MDKRIWLGLALVPVMALSWGLGQREAEAGGKDGKKKPSVEWLAFDKGLELAQKQNKLLVIDFYTDWCHWCKVMDKETYGNEKVIKLVKEQAIMAKVNAETNEKFQFRGAAYSGRELSLMFGVQGFPTTAFMNAKGELITAISGYIPADKFTMILKYLAGNWYEKMNFDEFVKKQKQAEDKS